MIVCHPETRPREYCQESGSNLMLPKGRWSWELFSKDAHDCSRSLASANGLLQECKVACDLLLVLQSYAKYAQGSHREERAHPSCSDMTSPMPWFQDVLGCFRVACSHRNPLGVHQKWYHSITLLQLSLGILSAPLVGAWAPSHIVKSCRVRHTHFTRDLQSNSVKFIQFSQESFQHGSLRTLKAALTDSLLFNPRSFMVFVKLRAFGGVPQNSIRTGTPLLVNPLQPVQCGISWKAAPLHHCSTKGSFWRQTWFWNPSP